MRKAKREVLVIEVVHFKLQLIIEYVPACDETDRRLTIDLSQH